MGKKVTVEEYKVLIQKLIDYYYTLFDYNELAKEIGNGHMNFTIIKSVPELLHLLKNVHEGEDGRRNYNDFLIWRLFRLLDEGHKNIDITYDDVESEEEPEPEEQI